MTAFWVSLFLVFLAEMGDKTQFATIALATRYSTRLVLAALTVSTLVAHLGSVYLGRAVHLFLPPHAIDVAAGLAFIGFGIWTLRPDKNQDDDTQQPSRFGPFLAMTITFFITEIGDKTMLATVAIGAQYTNVFAVWIGSTLGNVCADWLAITVGKSIMARLPDRMIRPTAATIFLLTGVVSIARVFLPATAAGA